jgi:hypothetical protein
MYDWTCILYAFLARFFAGWVSLLTLLIVPFAVKLFLPFVLVAGQ